MKACKLLIINVIVFLSACSGQTDPIQAFESGDYDTAYKLFTPLAKAGDLDAQNYLGLQYFLGLGVTKDHKKAVELYKLAAEKGHADAQRNLGDMLQNGYGTKQDFYKAFIWYFASAQQGNKSAKVRLEALSSENKLTPNQQMHAKIEANEFIVDPNHRFQSHDTYIDKGNKL